MDNKSELDALFKVSRILSGEINWQEILQQMVEIIAAQIDLKICSLMVLQEKSCELTIEATQSLSTAYRNKLPLKVGEGISGRVVLDKRPHQSEDVTNDPLYRYADIARREGLKAMLSVPMMVKNKVIGVINGYSGEKRYFKDDEIKIVQTIANQIAVAVDRQRSIEREKDIERILESRKAISTAKRMLMDKYKFSEEDAYRLIQKASMNKSKTKREIAEALMLTNDIDQVLTA